MVSNRAVACNRQVLDLKSLLQQPVPSENSILRLLHRAAVSVEHAWDRARYRASAAVVRSRPRQIVAYQGYADRGGVWVGGRVLSDRPTGGPLDNDTWWNNLVNTWRRWESDEVPYAPVQIRFGGQFRELSANEEGYYQARFDFIQDTTPGDCLSWLEATATSGSEGREITARHPVMVTPANAKFGIISDLDDTVIHTGITSLLLAAKLTFLGNAKTRKPLDGVAKLYQALQRGHASVPINPIFYISSSPWNLHDLLLDFLRLNEIPLGPILLRDLGFDETKFIKEKGHGHKRRKALDLLASFPELPFVLIGDSGQEDPTIYADIAAQLPHRIRAIYIRDVDPEFDTVRDTTVNRAMRLAEYHGVPMILAKTSMEISQHAGALGLLPQTALKEVMGEVVKDQERPGTGQQAIEDAVASILPE